MTTSQLQSKRGLVNVLLRHKFIIGLAAIFIIFSIIGAIWGGENYDPGAAAAKLFILVVIVLAIRYGVNRISNKSDS